MEKDFQSNKCSFAKQRNRFDVRFAGDSFCGLTDQKSMKLSIVHSSKGLIECTRCDKLFLENCDMKIRAKCHHSQL